MYRYIYAKRPHIEKIYLLNVLESRTELVDYTGSDILLKSGKIGLYSMNVQVLEMKQLDTKQC